MDERSPFPHQGPLEPAQLRARDALVADLVERATQRRVTALLGPRRFGKTSVLRKVAVVLGEATAVVWLDLYETRSAADLVTRLDCALAGTAGPLRDLLERRSASVSVNLGMFAAAFSRPPAQRPDADAALHVLIDLLVESGLRQPTTLVIDEFTGIDGVPGAAGLLRTKLQHHVQTIGLLLAGSEPTAMAAMFAHPSRPFYAQADIVTIQPFTPAELADIVEHGFEATGVRMPGGLAAKVHEFSHGHPHRAMQLADASWAAVRGGLAARDAFGEAVRRVRCATATGLETLFATFTPGEQAVLRATATGRPLFGATLQLLGASSSTTAASRKKLVASGTLTQDGRIVDPVLADWIRDRLPL